MLSFGISYWLSHFLGFVYPTYASYKALLTPASSDDSHVSHLASSCVGL